MRPSLVFATLRSLWLFAVATATVQFKPTLVHAQPTPRADGGPLPNFVVDRMREDPSAFQFSSAWIAETRRLKRNRALLKRGTLNIAGISPEQIQALTAFTGTKNVPIFLGKFSDTGAARPEDPRSHMARGGRLH